MQTFSAKVVFFSLADPVHATPDPDAKQTNYESDLKSPKADKSK
jgi:hypothetical protein